MLKREPKFGDRLRGIYASPNNPQRDGIYVETIHRTGRLNPGKHYRLTNGKGSFWIYPAESVTPIDEATPETRPDDQLPPNRVPISVSAWCCRRCSTWNDHAKQMNRCQTCGAFAGREFEACSGEWPAANR